MQYTTLGKTGLHISRLGFGGIPIQKVDAQKTRELMEELVRQGVNYIDTARGYTVSEAYLGEALCGIRDKFVVATKSMARTKDAMAKDIDISLANLKTDYIDLYQVHNPSMADLDTVCAPGGALEALLEAKAAGKIGHIGLTAQELEEIKTIRDELGTQFCRRCNYCQPCTAGINISGVFLMEGYLKRDGLGDWAKERYATFAKKAGDCIGCGVCETRCPYQLPIREMLARCKEGFGC